MDDLNITMEECIRLEEEKAQKRGKVFNWETAKYGKIWYDEDVHDLRSVATNFPAIVFKDNLTSNETLFCEPTVSSLNNNKIDFRISFDESDDEDYTIFIRHMDLPHRDQRHQYLRYEGLQYTEGDIADYETSIVGRCQAPEKVTVIYLFYLRGMDVDSINVPYLLARYLRLSASGRKQGSMISGGQFVAHLAEHFGLLTEERLQGLTVIVKDLPDIDMAELVTLQICIELDDTWAWVPAGPARQEGNVGGVAEEAPVAPKGGDEDEEMP
ncbi:hypothetical protein Tco_1525667 [Tanacetum coccineum]